MKKIIVFIIAAITALSAINAGAAETTLYGDANGDGIVNIKDATCIQRQIAGIEAISAENLKAASVSGEETLTVQDATLIQKYIAGIINIFPAEEKHTVMKMLINNTPVEVRWEENDAVAALKEAVKNSPLTINMSMYGGFEQVGSLGMSLPQNDVRTTTEAGDIVLYSGNQMVVFYGSNTWAYTRLGHISDKTARELTLLLSKGNVTITLTY